MSKDFQTVLSDIKNKKATVGIVGMGYVGLPLTIEFAKQGFPVVGLDIDRVKVDELNKGNSYIKHIPAEKIKQARQTGFYATDDFSKVSECDAVLLCVPTPLTSHREPDMSYIESTCESIYPHLQKNQLVILESTTYPGTTDDVMKPILEKSGLKAGQDFYLAYSPEREDPNNPNFNTSTIPKVVGGYDSKSLELAKALYENVIVKVVPVSSTRVAEASKIVENTFRAVNIAFVNELKMIFDVMGIDVWEVLDAAATKPFGFMKFSPGPGLGGHCIPIDPFYLTWKAREYDMPTRFIEMAGEINTAMPYYVVSKAIEILADLDVSIKKSKILIIGMAYKKNVDDTRESPSYKLMDLLSQKGATVDYHDPYVSEISTSRHYKAYNGKKSVPIDKISDYDLVLISTNHDDIDWDFVLENSKRIIDTRNVYKDIQSSKVVKA